MTNQQRFTTVTRGEQTATIPVYPGNAYDHGLAPVLQHAKRPKRTSTRHLTQRLGDNTPTTTS